MKKTGILNRDIARILATLGHTDHIVIADCGLPIPSGVECIDLSLRKGFPSFTDVLEEVLEDMEVEAMIAAEEVKDQNHIYTAIESKGIPTYYLPHQDLKIETAKAKAVIRTGEVTPFANVILRAGVLF
ncbi:MULTISPECIES: D-ribose pyranase [Shouchella]|uniref:D-ribose pyranase n=2 Tax=Shouchella TaxID=2893057 RepID=A0ABY7WE73_9BACI|nr:MULTISPECIES: D-ribose pyranase [Shouchella]MED4128782.1 D-ribose pyranase [Shouchella miscanthi]WDF05801.1 D-ribose pyranase [Shouchella hunanensis]GAF20436.1 ribose ABC transport system, high affinity permease RbsD [Bacillus sp. JCM 19047]